MKSDFMFGLQFVVALAILAVIARLYLDHVDHTALVAAANLANPTDHSFAMGEGSN